MAEPLPPSAILERHYELIRRTVSGIGYRNGFDSAEADELLSWSVAQLVDKDYAIIRKFDGRGSFHGYLSVVLSRLAIDFRNEQWGRWRVSAAARRLGSTAARLERLVYRDGRSLNEAIQTLRSEGIPEDEASLRRLFAQIPARTQTRTVGLEAAGEMAGASNAESVFWAAERGIAQADSEAALSEVLRGLDPEDRIIITLLFWDRLSVAEVARRLRLEQKPLYRRIESIQTRIRRELEHRGIDRERILVIVNEGVPA